MSIKNKSTIVFTLREIQNAWSNHFIAYHEQSIKTNSHRLMLFYAVECGLKAIIMKKERVQTTNSNLKTVNNNITYFSHNINQLLTKLNVNDLNLYLPQEITLEELKGGQTRSCRQDQINQMWRYGYRQNEIDQNLENILLRIAEFIKKYLPIQKRKQKI